ncbi:MAG: hypothetical protein L0220_07420, partial [Acidobacteria bacterium]|nr:hypothetical protein [Acidobacteriota bacterium]
WVYEHQIADIDFIYRYLQVVDLKNNTSRQLDDFGTKEGIPRCSFVVTIVPRKNWAIALSGTESVKVWDLASGMVVQTLRNGEAAPTLPPKFTYHLWSFQATVDGQYLILAFEDSTLKIFDLKTGVEAYRLKGLTMPVCPLIAGAKYLIEVNNQMAAKVWDLTNQEEIITINGKDERLLAVIGRPDGKIIFHIDCESSRQVKEIIDDIGITMGTEQILYASSEFPMTPDRRFGPQIVKDGSLVVWDDMSRKRIARFNGESVFTASAISPNAIVAVGELSGRMHFLKLENINFYFPKA